MVETSEIMSDEKNPPGRNDPGFETRAIHVGEEEQPYPYRAVTPPMVFSSTYSFESIPAFLETLGERRGIFYGRRNHPTGRDAEERLAGLEGSADAALFGSGMAAITAWDVPNFFFWTANRTRPRPSACLT